MYSHINVVYYQLLNIILIIIVISIVINIFLSIILSSGFAIIENEYVTQILILLECLILLYLTIFILIFHDILLFIFLIAISITYYSCSFIFIGNLSIRSLCIFIFKKYFIELIIYYSNVFSYSFYF